MKPRFVFVHGNDTEHWSFGWAKWLKDELDKSGYESFFETMPDSIIARSQYWLPFLKDQAQVGENDVVIGWSSGAVAAMRYAEDTHIKGSILISPCYTDLNDEMEKQSGYYDKPWNWGAIKNSQENIALFYGDDDPYIPQEEFEFIGKELDADIHKIHGAGHFNNQQQFSELLEYIKKTY
jgi:predicted alpha/beta hydrolase family esterase